MRTSLAVLIGSAIFAGSSFAFDDCGCTCSDNVRRVSDNRTTTESRPMADSRDSRDGFFMRDGKVMTFRNGQLTTVSEEMRLENGMRLQPDGVLILSDGTRSQIRERQWLGMDGRFSERNNENQVNRDGYYTREGKVFVFRNGSESAVTSEITMDNGSRLSADGTVIMRDGTRSRIQDNQRLGFDGRFSDRMEKSSVNASHERTENRNTNTNSSTTHNDADVEHRNNTNTQYNTNQKNETRSNAQTHNDADFNAHQSTNNASTTSEKANSNGARTTQQNGESKTTGAVQEKQPSDTNPNANSNGARATQQNGETKTTGATQGGPVNNTGATNNGGGRPNQ